MRDKDNVFSIICFTIFYPISKHRLATFCLSLRPLLIDIRIHFMADNYLERQFEQYQARKAAWEKQKKLGKKLTKPLKPTGKANGSK